MANIIKVSHGVQYINDGKAVTSFVCVKELIRILRNSNLLAPFSSLLDTICPRPILPYRYTNHDLLEQLVVAGLLGREDFNDAQELNNDAFARSCLNDVLSPHHGHDQRDSRLRAKRAGSRQRSQVVPASRRRID